MSGARYPGYNVMARLDTPSWNAKTRDVVEKRLAVRPGPRFFTEAEWRTLCAICDRIMPQSSEAPKIPIAAYVDEKLLDQRRDGYRYEPLPAEGEAWRLGLAALDDIAQSEHGAPFHHLPVGEQDTLLSRMQNGDLKSGAFQTMPSALFFDKRVLFDITSAFYAHPSAWNEIGFGGPASPRGYVRMRLNERDPWEAVAAGSDPDRARRKNQHVL